MGREIKRVPLDFSWPLNKVWGGFINPHYRECPAGCRGGYSPAYELVAAHVNSLMWDTSALRTPEYAKITSYLAGRAVGLFGHDSTDAWAAVKKLGELAGLPSEWKTCSVCEGEGMDPAVRDAYEAWEATEPPAGEGWQVWETVSEGSPVSPVFASPGELTMWLTGEGYTQRAAMAFVEHGWAPSFVIGGGRMGDGISMADAFP